MINAVPAYERGATGDGVIISLIDSGIDVNNPEFSGRIHPQSADLAIPGVVAPGDVRPGGPNLQDIDGHGTAVGSILAAARNDSATHGVAFLSTLLVFRTDKPGDQDTLLGAAIAEGVRRSGPIGARVINLSVGSSDPAARAQFRSLLAHAGQNDIVTALSVGNAGNSEPEASAMAATDPEVGGTAIMVGAVTPTGDLASFSNRAGAGANFYLVAPGQGVPVQGIGGGLFNFNGTSAAAPHVAGAAALIRQLWPGMTARQVVDILLTSATDLGAPGIDAVYGRGLLNVGRAAQPLGTLSTASVSGGSAPVTDPVLTIDPTLSSSLPDLGDFVFLDSYGRDFRASLNDLVVRASAAVDPIAVLQPYSRFEAATFGAYGATAHFRTEARDRTLFSPDDARRASAFGVADQEAGVDDLLSFVVTAPLGDGGVAIASRGFAARDLDTMSGRVGPRTISRDGFADSYLANTASDAAAAVHLALGGDARLDILAASGEVRPDFDAFNESEPAAVANARIGLTWSGFDGYFRLESGLRQERGALLGSRIDGAFDSESASSTFYQAISTDVSIGAGWRAMARAAFGRTDLIGGDGFLLGTETLATTQFAAGFAKTGLFAPGDQALISVSQPLRVESGALRIAAPDAYDYRTGAFSFSDRVAQLGNGPREIDIEAAYAVALGPRARLEANLLRQFNVDAEGRAATAAVLRAGFDF